jgi:hypothetical protein
MCQFLFCVLHAIYIYIYIELTLIYVLKILKIYKIINIFSRMKKTFATQICEIIIYFQLKIGI